MIDRRQSQLFMRLKKSATLCALACILGVSTSAAADEPLQNAPLQEGGEDEDQKGRTLGFVLLGTSCALGLGMAGLLLFIRRKRRDDALLDFEGYGPVVTGDFSPKRRTIELSGRAGDTSAESANVSAETVLEALGSSSVDFAPQQLGEPTRECPKCSRTFPSTIVVCPYDSSTLRVAKARTKSKRRRNKRRTQHGLERSVCTGCERRFGPDVDFCYHDGLPLMQDTRERAQHAPSFKACERCGWEGKGEALCPNDACASETGELLEIDASDATHVQPAIPMTVCPTCREYGTPGQAFCPNDGDVLTPLLNLRSTEFPARGFGPRRKVCAECGTEHGSKASYCSNDGSRLVALN